MPCRGHAPRPPRQPRDRDAKPLLQTARARRRQCKTDSSGSTAPRPRDDLCALVGEKGVDFNKQRCDPRLNERYKGPIKVAFRGHFNNDEFVSRAAWARRTDFREAVEQAVLGENRGSRPVRPGNFRNNGQCRLSRAAARNRHPRTWGGPAPPNGLGLARG